ncbi:MAG TPA: SDR family oxidoreductase [Bryobacteraceae bacterium]|nr:SDR family oxidoreductase [Bryobacteraceae bacterium]
MSGPGFAFSTNMLVERPEGGPGFMGDVMTGQVVIITGGSAGIGRAAVELFAQEGAQVVFAARSPKRGEDLAERLRAEGHQVLFIQADVSESAAVRRMVSRAVESFGRVDCAFNNAASLGSVGRLADYSEAEFDTQITANLKSVWLCMKYEIEQMKLQEPPGGSIVNTSSVNGLGGARSASLYSMAKAGILGLTKSAAQEYASDGIRVNALVAGGFNTDMLQDAIKQTVGNDPVAVDEAFKGLAARVPLGRVGNPQEAAKAALWLLSGSASYVTGLSMIVDGGLTSSVR